MVDALQSFLVSSSASPLPLPVFLMYSKTDRKAEMHFHDLQVGGPPRLGAFVGVYAK